MVLLVLMVLGDRPATSFDASIESMTSGASTAQSSVYAIGVTTIDGRQLLMDRYKGQVLLNICVNCAKFIFVL